MSIAEDLIMHSLFREPSPGERTGLPFLVFHEMLKKGLWPTRKGTLYHISEMTSSHLRNSIAMLERNYEVYDALTQILADTALEKMKAELEKRSAPVDPAFAWG